MSASRVLADFSEQRRIRVLDLGCGQGLTPKKLSFPEAWEVIGVDVNRAALATAHLNFSDRAFLCSGGENLPFASCSFDRVIANVALPYMRIPRALREIHRVLVPGGTLLASLHTLSFTISELRAVYKQKPKAALYRVWVLANGILFHVTGQNFGEAFQTERGIWLALSRAEFVGVSFRRDAKRWFVEARKAG